MPLTNATPTDSLAEPERRTTRPRATGLTCIIDTGQGVRYLEDLLECSAEWIDLAKLGWGTSIVTNNLDAKLAAYRAAGVETCLGGTLFELYYAHDRLDDYKRLLEDLNMTTVEISDGTLAIPAERKIEIIADFAKDFVVLSEVGSKDAAAVVAPARWVQQIRAELAAGAQRVILEGRESGTAGLYRGNGEMRTGLVEEITMAGIDLERLMFETPQRIHQSYLIKLMGANVNLANIAVNDVISLETLRRGLRSDTLEHFHTPT